MGRTVTDVAVMLGVLQSPFGAVVGEPLPTAYTQFLQRGALNGARIGVDERFFKDYRSYGWPGDDDTLPYVQDALDAMVHLGATLVPTDTGDVFAYSGDEFFALLCEFKAHLPEYLAELTHTGMRTLADLIAFNSAHCPAELAYYGQELFEISDSTAGLAEPGYLAARANALLAARSGIDNALVAGNLDAIVAPHLTNTTGPAVSGYPSLAMPVGITPSGKPAGMLMYSTFLEEPTLIGFGYDLEQELNVRRQPQFLGTVNDPPNAGLCAAPPAPHVFKGKAHLPHGRFF
jgi:amidase